MKCVLYVMAAAGLCASANADMITFGGQNYETVNWSSVSSATNTATGTAGGVGLTFQTVDVSSDSMTSGDFSSLDAAFDALSFQEGNVQSVSVMGGIRGLSSIVFDREISSLLIIIGAPNDATSINQFGASVWDFDDNVEMTIVDRERNPGLVLGAGNVLSNQVTGAGTHQSGVVGVSGNFTSLSWSQATHGGVDEMLVTFAVRPATIPAPATGLALLLPAAFAGRRRR